MDRIAGVLPGTVPAASHRWLAPVLADAHPAAVFELVSRTLLASSS